MYCFDPAWPELSSGIETCAFLYVGQERDGMRAILESYDSELATSEYSPQLTLRVKEAEDMLLKVQAHNSEMEVRTTLPIMHTEQLFQLGTFN